MLIKIMLCNLLILFTGFHYSLLSDESVDYKLLIQEILSWHKQLDVSDSSDKKAGFIQAQY